MPVFNDFQSTLWVEPTENKLLVPNLLLVLTALVCFLPMTLLSMGVDFSSPPLRLPENTADISSIEPFFQTLTGAFSHTLLEWSAFAIAVFTGFAALNHFHITKDITTPIIGIALLCSGSMDAFHTLAADRLITAVADNTNLIPFTWAVSRIFNAGLMIMGITLLLRKKPISKDKSVLFVSSIALVFITLGAVIIVYCANSPNLPQTQYPDSLITRPYDVIPLFMFLFAGLVLYPKFVKKYPSVFAYSLLLSAIPEVAVELHMVFGSSELFDAHFNIAHFLKVLAYLIPLLGLAVDYIRTYQKVENNLFEINAMKDDIQSHLHKQSITNQHLSRSNADLEQFALVASHDLREPLRKIQAFGNLLEEECASELSDDGKMYVATMQRAASRMDGLISSLLAFSRLGQENVDFTRLDLTQVANEVQHDLEILIKENNAVISLGKLPVIEANEYQMRQLFQNLLSNSIKFRSPTRDLHIKISAAELKQDDIEYWQLIFEDNGIGFDNNYQDKIFDIFKRLHTTKKYPGSGIGLSLCKRIVEHHNGEVQAYGIDGQGAKFVITLPTNRLRTFNNESNKL